MSARVLIVDDERGLRLTMAAFLQSEGYEVDTAENAGVARQLLAARNHHVVVADIILPGDSGLSLLRKIGESHPDTAVIMITGEPSYETAAEAVRAGAFDYLPKPLSKDAICRIVSKAVHLAELQRENRAYRENLEGLVQERTTELEAVNARLTSALEARRKAEEALERSQRLEAMGRLAGGVAHEFNSLLGTVVGYSTFLRESLANEDPMRADVEEIERAALRAASLTRKLLAFSRRDVINPELLDLAEVFGELEGKLRGVLRPGVEVELGPVEALPRVRMDRAHLGQVLANLVANAGEANPADGRIQVWATEVEASLESGPGGGRLGPGRYVRLVVADSGTGMSPETLEHACEPFFTTKPEREATGLGLAAVYGIVMQAGGDLLIRSTEGVGTTVEVFLPVADTGPDAPGQRAFDQPAATSDRCRCVLVVEDDPAILRLTSRILKGRGYDVLSAGSGSEALRLTERHPGKVDLLLADVIMPGMSGAELASVLHEHIPTLKVLFMSGYADDVVARQGVLADAASVLQKPFTMEQLVDAVARAVACAEAPAEPVA